MRRLPILVLVLVLALAAVFLAAMPVRAAPTAGQTWRKCHKGLAKQEEEFWDGFRSRIDAVYAQWVQLWRLWRGDPEFYAEEVDDLTGIRELYEDYLALQQERIAVDRDYAATGDARAAETLLGELFDVIKEEEVIEKELDEARPVRFSSYYDQRPGVKRHGLAARERGLVEVLAASSDAVAFLSDVGLAKAKKADRKKSIARRVAVLDALGLTRDPAARPALEAVLTAAEPGLRLVAAENLVPFGADVIPCLRPMLGDVSPVVVRALLEAVRRHAAAEPAWIPAVLDVYLTQGGLVRARALEALVVLTGQTFGDDPARWREWFREHEEAIAAGNWRRPEPAKTDSEETREGKSGEEGQHDDEEGAEEPPYVGPSVVPMPAVTFYGVPAPGRRVLFVLDGSADMDQPADLDTQKQFSQRHWQQTGPSWKRDHIDHRTFLLQEFERTLDAMPEDVHFAVVHLWGSTPSSAAILGEKKPLEPSKGTRRSVLKAVGKPNPQGQLSAEEGLRHACSLWGTNPRKDPKPGSEPLDTVFVVHTGWNGGRWGIPEALVADFERRNRFHRLQVNTIRITDLKEEAQRLLRGLAEVSGGTYHWLTELP